MTDPQAESHAEHPPRPLLGVVRGAPDDVELAALVAVVGALSARAGGTAASVEPPARSAWADRAGLLRAAVRPGPGAWRAPALPR